jgi:peptidoglycan hydrolase-like protein with peptidoglycan-binding domain
MTEEGVVEPDSAPDEVEIARIRHPLRVLAFLLAIGVLLAGAFAAGFFVKSPTDDALEVANSTVPVAVAVEERVVAPGYALPATVSAGTFSDVTVLEVSVSAPENAQASGQPQTDGDTAKAAVDSAPAADRAIVTSMPLAPGDVVGYGQLLAEVSGRPLFGVPATVPLYRDLILGAKGRDVSSLQQLLVDLNYYGVKATGNLDTATIDAVSRLYVSAGYELPFVEAGVRGIAWREFVALPAPQTTVSSVASTGQVLAPDTSLIHLQTSPAVLTARMSALERDVIQVGTQVQATVAGGDPVATSVTGIGEFSTDEQSGSSGYPITVALPAELAISPGAVVQITPLETPPASLAVPLPALRQDDRGTFVILAALSAADATPTAAVGTSRRIDVEVTDQADGWVAIAANERLPAGTRLEVTP